MHTTITPRAMEMEDFNTTAGMTMRGTCFMAAHPLTDAPTAMPQWPSQNQGPAAGHAALLLLTHTTLSMQSYSTMHHAPTLPTSTP